MPYMTCRSHRFRTHLRMGLACLSLMMLIGFAAPALGQDQPEAAAAVALRPQWKPGQTSRYQVWSKRDRRTTMTAAGRSRESSVSIQTEGEITWQVQRVAPDGSARCTMTYDWLASTLTAPDGETTQNDSRRPTGDIEPVHQMLRALAGVPIEVYIAADGSVERVAGLNAISQALEVKEMMPDELDFKESANELAVLAHAPETAKPSDTWQASERWTHDLGHLDYDLRYTLQAVEQVEGIGVATIVAKARPRLDVDRSQMPDDGPPIDIRLTDSSFTSETMFDLQRRETVGRNTVQLLTVDVTIRLPNATMQQQVHETIQSQTLRLAEE